MQKGVSINTKALAEAIEKSGYTASDISTILGMGKAYISQALGRGVIGEDKLKALGMVLKVSPDTLVANVANVANAKPQEKNNEELLTALHEVVKLLREDVEVRTRSEAKLSEVLLEIQKMGTRANKYYNNMENWKKFGHF